jgi:predicted DCC family thiol-disulfide oxidoreductase YuxK
MGPPNAASGALTVLYDEGCRFCFAIAAWLVRTARGRLRAEPIGSPLGADALRDLDHDARYASVHVVDERGRRWSGAASLPHLARATRGLRWAALPLERFPGMTRAGYDWITRHRRLLSRLLERAGHGARDTTA